LHFEWFGDFVIKIKIIMNKKILFISIFFAALINACTKDVSIPVQAYEPKISIQSLITPNQIPKVYLNQTVAFFDTKVKPVDLFIRNAVVRMSNPDGEEILQPDSTWNAYRCYYEYFFSGKIAIQANKTYTLTVLDRGNTYTASAKTDRRKVQLDSVTYTTKFKDLYGEHEGIISHFKDLSGIGEYFRFDMGLTFGVNDTLFGPGKEFSPCALGKTTWVQEIGRSIYPDNNADGTAFTLTIEPTYKHKKDLVAYVRLQSVDKAMYEFYDQYDRQKLAQYNPFVEPIFILPGQFGDKAFGVFGAYIVSDSLRFVYPE
jgi:hypothetical protein